MCVCPEVIKNQTPRGWVRLSHSLSPSFIRLPQPYWEERVDRHPTHPLPATPKSSKWLRSVERRPRPQHTRRPVRPH